MEVTPMLSVFRGGFNSVKTKPTNHVQGLIRPRLGWFHSSACLYENQIRKEIGP